MTAVMVHAEGLRKAFGSRASRREAIAGVSLQVAAGEVVVVQGPSGSGKTTLLNLLAGIEPADDGHAWIGETEVTAARDDNLAALRAGMLGLVPQEFALVGVLTAQENVELPLRLAGVSSPERTARATAILDAFGLAPHAAQRPERLSGGQQQRVALARALVHEPSVLLADEPSAQLDSATARAMMALIVGAAREVGMAVLLTTHDPELVSQADRVLRLIDGRLA